MIGPFDLDPDGIQIVVDWDKFLPGASVFVPCINTTAATSQLGKIAAEKDWEIDTRVRIENGNRGVRVWRIL